MNHIPRLLLQQIHQVLDMGKSILLLGPRQTGKTTLVQQLSADLQISLASTSELFKYTKTPFSLSKEVEYLYNKATATDNTSSSRNTSISATSTTTGTNASANTSISTNTSNKKLPLIVIDEIQKVPLLMDEVQTLIDRKKAQFILTGSSARKLKRHGGDINLLPGRVLPLRLDPFSYSEAAPFIDLQLETLLLDGTLPEILLTTDINKREYLLDAYVNLYLTEEIQAEAIVRDLSSFARFLELAAAESGNLVNFAKLSQEIGVSHTTIMSYYQILQDCLIIEKVEPLLATKTRRKLIKSSKYLLYDLGVRRIAVHEGRLLAPEQMGKLFEQYVGLELIHLLRLNKRRWSLKYWRDVNGIEVDWVINTDSGYIPIEVKWTESPSMQDAKHLKIFLNEHEQAKSGFIICRTPRPMQLAENIVALPWQQLGEVLE